MEKPSRWQNEKSLELERVRNSPSPTTYDALKAFDKSVSPRIKTFKLDKKKKESFVDLMIQ